MYRHSLAFVLLAVTFVDVPMIKGQSGERQPGLFAEYRLAASSVDLHAPILMQATILNHLASAARVDLGQDRRGAFEVSVEPPDGKTAEAKLPLHEGMSVLGTVEIAPGGSYAETLVLNEWYPFSELGVYRIRVRLFRPPGTEGIGLSDGLGLWVNLPPLQVTSADPQRLAAICEDLKTKLEATNSYPEVAQAAVELSYVDDPIAVPYLRDMAFLRSGALAPLAARGLERLGTDSAIDALILLSKEPNVAISSPARFSLFRIAEIAKDPTTRARIKDALAEP